MALCVCLDVFRRQVNFSDKIVMHINLLYSLSTGPIRGMDNDFLHKFMEQERRQFRGFSVLLYNFKKLWILTSSIPITLTSSRSSFTELFKSACSCSYPADILAKRSAVSLPIT